MVGRICWLALLLFLATVVSVASVESTSTGPSSTGRCSDSQCLVACRPTFGAAQCDKGWCPNCVGATSTAAGSCDCSCAGYPVGVAQCNPDIPPSPCGVTECIAACGPTYATARCDQGWCPNCIDAAPDGAGACQCSCAGYPVGVAQCTATTPTTAGPVSYGAAVLSDSPVLYFPFAMGDQSRGYTTSSVSPATHLGFDNSYNTPVHVGTTYTSPLAASNNYVVDFQSNAGLTYVPGGYRLTSAGLTVEAFFCRTRAFSATNNPIGGIIMGTSPYSGWTFGFAPTASASDATTLLFAFNDVPTGGTRRLAVKMGTQTSWALNQWYHVAVTWDGTNAQFYIDGAVDGPARSMPLAGPVADQSSGSIPLSIGTSVADGTSTAYPIPGRLDEVAAYGRALTTSAILRHKQAASLP